MRWGISLGKKGFFGYDNTSYSQQNGNHVYSLTNPDLGKWVSCFDGGYSELNMITLFQTIPEVFAPIDAIASRVALGQFQLVDDKTNEPVTNDKTWLKISTAPNWRQTFAKLIYDAVVYKYTTGNMYLHVFIPDTLPMKAANVSALWALPAPYMRINQKTSRPKLYTTTSANDVIDNYQLVYGADTQTFTPDTVHHEAFVDVNYNTSPQQMFKGISPLRACEYPMSNIIAVYQARNIIQVKQGALGMLVSKKSDASGLIPLTKKEKEELVNDYQSSYGITGDKSPVGITSMPMDFIRMGMSIKDLEPFTETEQSTAAIYKALGIDTDLMPRVDNSTFENMKSAERNLYQNVCIGLGQNIARILTNLLGYSKEGKSIKVSYDHIEVLQENKLERSRVDGFNNSTYLSQFTNGIITLNQWRNKIGEEDEKNPLYDKLVYNMSPDELDTVKSILSIKSSAAPVSGGNPATDTSITSNA